MSALPRPDIPPGPHRDLVDALHDLHHRAGWPSLRRLAAAACCSHTTVSKAFSSTALPAWGTLELLVEAMAGDTATFHDLWLAASIPSSSDPGHRPPATRIAGRRAELAAVRHHLQTGTGLLLVSGEAGIGKTRLVTTAAQATDTFVAAGHCLPLSTQVPLLAVADALRGVMAHDDGQWVKEALADCPSYVATSLVSLLPELDDGTGAPAAEGEFSRHRLFVAVGSALAALARLRPFAVVLEDLHWADDTTLDLVQHLATRPDVPPIVGTWRTDDPDVPETRETWLARARHVGFGGAIDLVPLSREDTAEQLHLITGVVPEAHLVDRIQAQGGGLPLYTDQLASTLDDPLPERLSDLLDRRLGDLTGPVWRVARVLGVADRAVRSHVLRAAAGLGTDELESALRALSGRRLLAPSTSDEVVLGHPLFAEAIRRRLVAGEGATVHARLAELLEGDPDAEPGEIARHWQAAGSSEELRWRVLAAEHAAARFAWHEELVHWRRVVQLRDVARDGAEVELAVDLAEVLCKAIDASYRVADVDAARELVDRALALNADRELPDEVRVQILRRAGDLRCDLGDSDSGRQLLDEALGLVRRLPPAPELVEVLVTRIGNLSMMGRHEEVRADIARAREMLESVPDDRQLRRLLNWAAWFEMARGDHRRAWELSSRARAIPLPDEDPMADLALAANATDLLLHAAAEPSRVVEAAGSVLESAARWHLEDHAMAGIVRGNLAEAHLRAGQVEAAAEALASITRGDPHQLTAAAHVLLAAVELRRGDVAGALLRAAAAEATTAWREANWAEGVPRHAEAQLWAGHPEDALRLLQQALDLMLPTDNARTAAPCLTMWARATADLASTDQAGTSAHPSADGAQAVRRLREVRARVSIDPFGPEAIGAAVPAFAATWEAELARLARRGDVGSWARAAEAWDALRRPHDSAYCRWRGAQAALRVGQGTVAARLLKRAARDAREHVPLSRAIAATAAGATSPPLPVG